MSGRFVSFGRARAAAVASLVTVTLALAAIFAPTAGAAELDDVASAVASTGLFVEDGSSATESQIGSAVAAAREAGENLSIVVLAEEPAAGAVTFADTVFGRVGEGLVLVITPESVGYGGLAERFDDDNLLSALDRALERGGADAAIAESFVATLTGQPVGDAAPPSGGGSGWIWLLVIVVAGGALVLWAARRSKRRSLDAAQRRLDEARAEIQRQVDAVANDILELEDEVRVAEDPRVADYYEEAAETYRTAGNEADSAKTSVQLLEVANDLDEAIWKLDAVEAIIDGKPIPDQPLRRTLEPVAAPSGTPEPTPSPRVIRRPSRRSSYVGPGMLDLLTMVAGSMASGRVGRARRPRFPGARSTSPSRRQTGSSRTRSRGGSRVRGGGRRRR